MGIHRRHRGLSVLLIDDIQFLGDKAQTEGKFFHTVSLIVDGIGIVEIFGPESSSKTTLVYYIIAEPRRSDPTAEPRRSGPLHRQSPPRRR